MRIGFKKSFYKGMMKSFNELNKLQYFKKKLIEILDRQEQQENRISKALEEYDMMQKAGFGIGTVREWKGKKFRKIAPGKWRRIYSSNERGINVSIANVKKAINNAKDIKELGMIVSQNIRRFYGEDGKLLPIAQQILDEAKGKQSNFKGSHPVSAKVNDDSPKENNAAGNDVYDLRASKDNPGLYEVVKNGKMVKLANEKGVKKYLSDFGIKINGENTTPIKTGKIKDNSQAAKKDTEKDTKLIESLSVWKDRIYLNGKALNGSKIYLVEAADGTIEPKYSVREGSTGNYEKLLFAHDGIYRDLEEFMPGITKMKFKDLIKKLNHE